MNLNVAIMNRSQRHWHSFIINLSPEKVVNSQFSLCYTCLLCPSWYALFYPYQKQTFINFILPLDDQHVRDYIFFGFSNYNKRHLAS